MLQSLAFTGLSPYVWLEALFIDYFPCSQSILSEIDRKKKRAFFFFKYSSKMESVQVNEHGKFIFKE